MRGWVYHWAFGDDGDWFAALADGPPGEGDITDDLGTFPNWQEAMDALNVAMKTREANQ